MVHVNFDPDSIDWRGFFLQQEGGGMFFEGIPFQRGYGIGSVLGNLFRYLVPIGKTIGKELGREGLSTGSRVLTNMMSGETLKNSLRKEGQQGLKNVLDRVYEKTQTGQGRRKSIKGKKTPKIYSKTGPKKRIDYLGSF